jgi:hypothetical protein
MIRIITCLIAFAAVAACGTPNPPTVSTRQVGRSFEEARAIGGLPFTATQDLPSGSVTYIGKLGADVSGDLDGSIISDMRMNVGFSTNDISGSVTNINLINPDGRPNQLFDGRLIIDGAESEGRINAFASGDITGVNDRGFPMDSNLLLQLQGNVVDDIVRGDAVFGSAKGNGIGDLDIGIDGVFFGTAD